MTRPRAFLLLLCLILPAAARSQPALPPGGVAADLLAASREASAAPAPAAFLQEESAPPERKSVFLAAAASLVLPGMGELYAGGFSSGKYFLAAEGVLWLTYGAFTAAGDASRDDARAFAAANAGVTPEGKDDQYFVDIGNFLDINEYNEKQLRDREPERLYNASPSAGYAWAWDSDASRAAYRDQRISSDTQYNNRKFVVAAIVINHVASAINAGRAAAAYNRALDEQHGRIDFGATVLGGMDNPHGLMITVTRTF